MMKKASISTANPTAPVQSTIRCAIYTRKSSEEGLEQEFNSLDAQRESGEAYIASLKGEGWICLPDRYDDGGFTGGNMDRPAVQRLMADIEAGKIDCVLVYKVDRLSRSLADFGRLMETFDEHNVSFVSVTQQFNTANSMGRLMLNVLLSFAQFEREIISERTRDKIAAARKKGKYSGGRPVLGFDVVNTKLIINESEAAIIREIFAIYLRTESLSRTVAELGTRGWTTKRWTSRDGRAMGGSAFHKSRLYSLLTNVLYVGKVSHGKDVYPGEQAAIVDEETWMKVQGMLQENGRTGGSEVMNRHGAVLKGILRCGSCDKPMIHSCTNGDHGRRYRYYVCHAAQAQGYHTCGTRSIPAESIEQFVLERVRTMGRDQELVTLILDQARREDQAQVNALESELQTLEREMKWLVGESRRTSSSARTDPRAIDRLAEVTDRSATIQKRAADLNRDIDAINGRMVTRDQVEANLLEFEPLWRQLSPRERGKLLRLVIKRVEYDGAGGEVAITFQPEAKWLAQEVTAA